MFIIWGTKQKERRIGFVADFCPICRSIQPFELLRVGLARHVYYITFGSGKLVGHLGRCQSCRCAKSVNATRFTQPAKDTGFLDRLIEQTFPTIRAFYAERLALEEQILRSPSSLSEEQRATLLLEPFQYLADEVEKYCTSDTRFDKQSALGCLGTIAAVVFLFIVGCVISEGNPLPDWVAMTMLVIFVIGTIYTLVSAPVREHTKNNG